MLAAQSGRAESELVREGLDLALEGASVTDENWRERLSEVLASLDGTSFDAAIVKRMRRNKAEQAAKWRKRLERTRKALSGE